MRLFDIHWSPSARQLRQFGIICLVALPLLGLLWGGGTAVVASLAAVGLALAALAFLAPGAVKPVFLAASIAAAPIGLIVGEAAMLLIYFGVFLPIGLLLRLLRRDHLRLARDPGAATYWKPKKAAGDLASYYRQS